MHTRNCNSQLTIKHINCSSQSSFAPSGFSNSEVESQPSTMLPFNLLVTLGRYGGYRWLFISSFAYTVFPLLVQCELSNFVQVDIHTISGSSSQVQNDPSCYDAKYPLAPSRKGIAFALEQTTPIWHKTLFTLGLHYLLQWSKIYRVTATTILFSLDFGRGTLASECLQRDTGRKGNR